MLLLYVVDRMNLRIDHILPSINSRITLLSLIRCFVVIFAFALSDLVIGSDIITLYDGNVNSICDFNCNNSVNIVSEVFKITSFVETCKIM